MPRDWKEAPVKFVMEYIIDICIRFLSSVSSHVFRIRLDVTDWSSSMVFGLDSAYVCSR
jgi:hypothetical protein